MNKIVGLILILAVFSVGVGIGTGMGIFYQNQKDAAIQKKADLVKNLNMETVPSIIVAGKVVSNDGKNITVLYNGKNVTVQILDTAQITSIVPAGATYSRQNAKITDIKTGSTVSIAGRLLSSGDIQGVAVTIVP